MGRRKTVPAAPATVRAVAQANVGGLRRGRVVEVLADDPRLGHYLRPVDPAPEPAEPSAVLLGVAPPDEDGDGAQPG